MLLLELFDKDNILCPEWLSEEFLEDDWQESVYSYEDGKHTWSLENDVMNNKITFDGTECTFLYMIEELGEMTPFRIINKDSEIQT